MTRSAAGSTGAPPARGRRSGRGRRAQRLRQPERVLGYVLEQEGKRLGDRVVAQVAVLDLQRRIHVRVVLGVPGLVKEGGEVLPAPDPRHDEIDLLGHPHRRAVGPRGLRRALLGVEDDSAVRPSSRPSRAVTSRSEGSRRGASKAWSRTGARKNRARSARAESPSPKPSTSSNCGPDQLRVALLGRGQEGRGLVAQPLQIDAAKLRVGVCVAAPAEASQQLVRALQRHHGGAGSAPTATLRDVPPRSAGAAAAQPHWPAQPAPRGRESARHRPPAPASPRGWRPPPPRSHRPGRGARRRRARADRRPPPLLAAGRTRPSRSRCTESAPEQARVVLVDPLHLELELLPREMEVVLAVQVAEEPLRRSGVGVEVEAHGLPR